MKVHIHIPFGVINVDPFMQTISDDGFRTCLYGNMLAWLYSCMATETFAVLAEPMRRRLLDLLLDRPRPVGELAALLGLSQPGTSKHLRVLRDAGLVRVRQDAQRRWYELEPGPLTDIDDWLRPYRKVHPR
jgi:DNA-binding transcriptional ArsR family regulator